MLINYLKRFFRRSEAADCSPRPEETIGGKAFTYKKYTTPHKFNARAGDALRATITDDAAGEQFSVQEEVAQSSTITAVAIFRAKEAFGMTDVIGAAFGDDRKR